jgi:hypothetical protein
MSPEIIAIEIIVLILAINPGCLYGTRLDQGLVSVRKATSLVISNDTCSDVEHCRSVLIAHKSCFSLLVLSRVLEYTEVTIAHCKTYWFSESIQSKVLSEASTILKVIALQST